MRLHAPEGVPYGPNIAYQQRSWRYAISVTKSSVSFPTLVTTLDPPIRQGTGGDTPEYSVSGGDTPVAMAWCDKPAPLQGAGWTGAHLQSVALVFGALVQGRLCSLQATGPFVGPYQPALSACPTGLVMACAGRDTGVRAANIAYQRIPGCVRPREGREDSDPRALDPRGHGHSGHTA